MLTAAAIVRLKPGAERSQFLVGGCPNLYIVVQPSGHKSFAMRFRRPDGRQAKLVLGAFAHDKQNDAAEPEIGMPLTLAQARALGYAVHRQRAQGRDVIEDRNHKKRRASFSDAASFATAARDFVEQHARTETRRWHETARLLGLVPVSLAPIRDGLAWRWARRAASDITAEDIVPVVDEARERAVPGLAARRAAPSSARARALLSAISTMFDWLVEKRRLIANPCAGLARPAAPRARERVLIDLHQLDRKTGKLTDKAYAEVVAFWRAAECERPEVSAALKILLLTAQRLSEVLGMRRLEISGAVWTIPGARSKNGREHAVALVPAVRGIIASLPTTGDLMFTTNGRVPLGIGSKIKKRLDARMGASASWVLHDARRTAATAMAELGVAPHVIEAILNHISGHRAGVAGTYNRSKLIGEQRAALELWASHVTRLVRRRGR